MYCTLPCRPVPAFDVRVNVDVAEQAHVKILVFNIAGELVETLVNELKLPGTYICVFTASNLPSGVYIMQMQAGNYVASKKMTLLK